MPNPQADQILDLPKRGLPVTVITGFLGSGKTTLLNNILARLYPFALLEKSGR